LSVADSAPPNSLAGFEGPLRRGGREGSKGEEGMGKGKVGKGREKHPRPK